MTRYFVTDDGFGDYTLHHVWRVLDDEFGAVEVARCANPLDAINIAKMLTEAEATTP